MNNPYVYRIRIEGHLSGGWSGWFAGLTVNQQECGETLLAGVVADQAALHGILAKIRDLNLTLIAIERHELSEPATDDSSGPQS